MNMIKKISLTAACLLSASFLFCQEPCEEAFQLARDDYYAGRLNEVVRHLEGCAFNQAVPRPLRRNMLALLAETYVFLDEEERAEDAYSELLRLDPFFRLDTKVPELRLLSETHLTYPVTTYTFYTGIYLRSIPLVQKQYSPNGVDILSEFYDRSNDDLFGWTTGINVHFDLYNSNFDLGLGYGISNIFFRYNAELDNALAPNGERLKASLSFQEKQRWNQFPVILTYNLIPKSKIIYSKFVPYIYAGAAWDVLIRNSAEATGPSISFDNSNIRVSTDMLSLRENRNRNNVSFLFGAGVRLHLKRFFISLEGRYDQMLQNMALDRTRFSNTELNQTYNYADDDFKLHNYGVCLGAGLYLFNSPKR